MITDPRTIPGKRGGRRVYAVGVGLLATLLIAPQTTEFATKVAILAALFALCATRGVIELVGQRLAQTRFARRVRRAAVVAAPRRGSARLRRRSSSSGDPGAPGAGSSAAAALDVDALPEVTVVHSEGSRQSTPAGSDDRAGRPRRSPTSERRRCGRATPTAPRRQRAAPGSRRSGTDPRRGGRADRGAQLRRREMQLEPRRGATRDRPRRRRPRGNRRLVDLRAGAPASSSGGGSAVFRRPSSSF